MKVGRIKYRWFSEGDQRFDSSFHLSDGRTYRKLLEKSPLGNYKLAEVANDIFNGARFKRYYVEDERFGIPFMGSSDMLKSDFNGLKFLSKRLSKNVDALKLKKDWILVSCSGTIGNTVYTNSDFEDKTASQHVLRIVPNGKVKPGYLYAFLSSKFGYSLLTQGTYGAVIQHIEPHHIEDLPIPVLKKSKESEINSLVLEASNLRVQANAMLHQADEIFKTQLNLDDTTYSKISHPFESRTKSSFIVSRSQIQSISIRARTYSARLKAIENIFNSMPNEKLISLLKYPAVKGGRYKRIETSLTSQNAVELLNQGDLHNRNPKGKIISKKYIDSVEDQTAVRNMIIVPAVGTLGENEIFSRPLFVFGYLEGKVLSEHLLRIMPDEKKIPAGYLFTVLRSKLFFRVFRSLVYGTNLLYYILPLLHQFPVPRFEKEIEGKISSLVKEAHKKLTAANESESRAIVLTEKEIESWQKS